MAESRRRDEWDRAAQWFTLFANANRDPKRGRPYRVEDFHPFAVSARRKPTPLPGGFEALKAIYGRKRT